jgi:hypothetical protein
MRRIGSDALPLLPFLPWPRQETREMDRTRQAKSETAADTGAIVFRFGGGVPIVSAYLWAGLCVLLVIVMLVMVIAGFLDKGGKP